MLTREATDNDFEAIWPIFHEIASTGETYGFSPDASKETAFQIWMEAPRKTYVCEDDGAILGTYYLKTNYEGPGAHVCNCGYMVATAARGRGVATKMCEHSQKQALGLGYKAMQFNYVAASNEGAVALWSKLGFSIVGRVPRAFRHPDQGFVDALIMYKWLETQE